MIILGIDPGSTRVGYGAIKSEKSKLEYFRAGLLEIPRGTKSEQLLSLERSFEKLLNELKPSKTGLEKLFFFKNKKTVIEVAQARGVILSVLARKGIPLVELTPSEIKMSVTGNGRASKQAVAKMVSYFLNLNGKKLIDDITDALAVAIAISNKRGVDI